MKVTNNKDTVELSNLGRAKGTRRADAAAQAKQSAEKSEINSVAASDAAKVELSSEAKILAKGIDAARNAELSDQDKINMIKKKIKDGSYEPDYGEVADRMLNQQILNS